jgi:hypothetical protein
MTRPETASQLRKWLADRLGSSDVSAGLWSLLDELNFVRPALDSDEPNGLQDLLDFARKLQDVGRELVGDRSLAGRRRQLEVASVENREEARRATSSLNPKEKERAKVMSEYFAARASKSPMVVHFRQRYLAGRTLSTKQAIQLLASPAPYFLGRSEFETRGIPLLGHRATAKRTRKASDGGLGEVDQFRLKVRWRRCSRAYRFPTQGRLSEDNHLDLPFEVAQQVEAFPVCKGSVFAELKDLSTGLRTMFPWHPAEALWFLLTGKAPFLLPLRLGRETRLSTGGTHDALRLTVEPWVSVKTLTQVFKAYQQAALGRSNRSLGPRSLELFRFGMRYQLLAAQDRSGPWLQRKWNGLHPEWAFSDYRNLRRELLRVAEAILPPPPPHARMVIGDSRDLRRRKPFADR